MSINYSVTFSCTFDVQANDEKEAKAQARQEFESWLSENAFASDFVAHAEISNEEGE